MSVTLKPQRLSGRKPSAQLVSFNNSKTLPTAIASTTPLEKRIEETVNSTILNALCATTPTTSGHHADLPGPLVIVETLPPKKRKKAYFRHSSLDNNVIAEPTVTVKVEPEENGFDDAIPLPVVINDCGDRLKSSPPTADSPDEPLDFSIRPRIANVSGGNTTTTVTTSKPPRLSTGDRSRSRLTFPTATDLFPPLLTIPPLYPLSVGPLQPANIIPTSFAYPPLYPGFPLFPYFDTKLFGDLSAILKGSEFSQKAVETDATHDCAETEPDDVEVNVDVNSDELDGEGNSGEEEFFINPITGNRVRRNYKNMTRERRVEANARERTRVHTIGAAFDRLRRLVPSFSRDQKLSKLSILRIACSYIMLLAAMNDMDYSLDQRGYTVSECADLLSNTILQETKYKAK